MQKLPLPGNCLTEANGCVWPFVFWVTSHKKTFVSWVTSHNEWNIEPNQAHSVQFSFSMKWMPLGPESAKHTSTHTQSGVIHSVHSGPMTKEEGLTLPAGQSGLLEKHLLIKCKRSIRVSFGWDFPEATVLFPRKKCHHSVALLCTTTCIARYTPFPPLVVKINREINIKKQQTKWKSV